MWRSRFRFNIRTLMVLVAISAVALAAWNLVPGALDLLIWDRGGTIPARWIGRGASRYIAVRALITGIVALPFSLAVFLSLKAPTRILTWKRRMLRWLGVVLSLAFGLAILGCPLDGLRVAWLLRDRSGVCFYHQCRIWPGAQVTPCLELIAPNGDSRSYPIARDTRYRESPQLRTDAEQTLVWLVDDPGARIRHGGVWCSMNRKTGEFIGAGGPYPAGVGETSGFPPSR